jgi:hypothetical protein
MGLNTFASIFHGPSGVRIAQLAAKIKQNPSEMSFSLLRRK